MSVTVRAVNHRYLDLQLRVPQRSRRENRAARARPAARRRGRVELLVALQLRQPRLGRGRAERAVCRGARGGARAGARSRAGHRRAGARRSAAAFRRRLSIRERPPEATRPRCHVGALVEARRRRGARRPRRDARDAKAGTCAPTSTGGARRWPSSSTRRSGAPTDGTRRSKRGWPSASASSPPTSRSSRRLVAQEIVAPRPGPTSARRSCGSAATSPTGRRSPTCRALRPKARFPAAGDEPRGQHDRHRKPRARRVSELDHCGEGGAREDARAGAECRIAQRPSAACCSSCRRPPAPGRRRWSSGWSSACRICGCRGPTRRAARGRAKPTAWTIISSAATGSRR